MLRIESNSLVGGTEDNPTIAIQRRGRSKIEVLSVYWFGETR